MAPSELESELDPMLNEQPLSAAAPSPATAMLASNDLFMCYLFS